MDGMTQTYFEVRDQALPQRAPLARTVDYDAVMRAVAWLQEQFWVELDANGEGGQHTRLRLQVVELTPGRPGLLRATAVASG
ncbi:hypothetical protein acdb102_21760 [Acidothermaceae bacterium B102]|nr:hypothetical protein acdb102_21760 [Acidothermaceae bacterium B102]